MKKNIYNNQINLFNDLIEEGYNFFTGVPDSLLKKFIELIDENSFKNVIATHESQAVAIAVGVELTGIKTCVYLQNSGLGNLVNPISSLCYPFKIFPLLVIGHRHTLEQHKMMGEIDKKILKLLKYKNYIIVNGNNNVE